MHHLQVNRSIREPMFPVRAAQVLLNVRHEAVARGIGGQGRQRTQVAEEAAAGAAAGRQAGRKVQAVCKVLAAGVVRHKAGGVAGSSGSAVFCRTAAGGSPEQQQPRECSKCTQLGGGGGGGR